MRETLTLVRVMAFRRVGDRRGLRRFLHGRRLYEVKMSDGSLRTMSLTQLDGSVGARRRPADFWAAVEAADWQKEHQGDAEEAQMIAWPAGTPEPRS